MNCKKAKTYKIIKNLNFFASTALLTLLFFSHSYAQTCPVMTSDNYMADTSTLGYSTSYNKATLDTSQMQSSTATECKDLPSNIIAQPGLNCLYDGKPLCQNIVGSSYSIPSNNILSLETAIHRYNCHDLIDLPLCELLSQNSITTDAGKNCVIKCSDIAISNDPAHIVRGQDYAVHNRDCVRFCDEIDEERLADPTLESSPSCIAKSCHQLGWNIDSTTLEKTDPILPEIGDSGNCNQLPCNLLYPIELANTVEKISDDENENRIVGGYCNKEKDALDRILKCYHFSKPQLQYTIRDKMCKIHKCQPSCNNYNSQIDENSDGVIDSLDHNDTLNISNKGTGDGSYTDTYLFHQYSCLDLLDKATCEPTICLPIVDRQYRCTTDGTTITGTNQDIVANNNCGPSDEEQDCSSNFCKKIIDCNVSANDSEPECIIGDTDSFGSADDGDLNSWFYRPKPLDKVVKQVGDYTIIDPEINDKLCFDTEIFKDRAASWTNIATQEDWGWDSKIRIPTPIPNKFITIDLGYFHSSISPDATRAGGMCKFNREADNVGFRGTNYPYLCYRNQDGHGQLTGGMYQQISRHTAFYKGYTQTTFLENEDATHKINVCLRFRNALRPDYGYSETCGSRECAVTCMGFAGGCSQQNCGYDKCVTLEVRDSKPDECEMSRALFDADQGLSNDIENSINGDHRKCLKTIDGFLRIRAQKIGDYVCAFLDSKGQTAYPENAVQNPIQFADGTEFISDENGIQYCMDGKIREGSCNTFDSRNNPESAEKWRTVEVSPSSYIPYILNNQPSSANFRGFMDRNGKVHLEQPCMKVTLRSGPLDFYNIATPRNSSRLFVPPIYIANVRKYIGGPISLAENIDDIYGATSFHYPEIEVKFGDSSELLNLSMNEEGSEDNFTTISTTVNGGVYNEDIFIKKEYNINSHEPILCLYQKILLSDGTYTTPYQIGCVAREKPQIDNSLQLLIDPNTPIQKIIINENAANSYNNSSMMFQYMGGDNSFSQSLQLANNDISTPTCDDSLEKYKICVMREECSQLNIECMDNEINLQNAINNGESSTSFLAVRNWCNTQLVTMCNNKLGLSTTSNSSIYNPNPSGA